MTTYEPGTVAVATVRGHATYRVMRVVLSGGAAWAHSETHEGFVLSHDSDVTDIRPLVALDLDESVGKASLPNWLRNNAAELERGAVSPSSFFKDMNWLADQIERQTKPPRIPEPGLGKHVTAGKPDGIRAEFVRVGSRHWSEIGTGSGWDWSELVDPEAVAS